jgi:dTDP-4-dehydrorhamnose reductase
MSEMILVTGASGLVGTYLLRELNAQYEGNIYVTTHKSDPQIGKRIKVDLANAENVFKILEDLAPDIIINLAALTNVDKCEIDHNLAFALNKDLVYAISRHLQKNTNGFVLHVSTDYVFDGNEGNYSENSVTNPINTYGVTKLQGERQLTDSKLREKNWCVARTSTPFGIHTQKQSFPLFIVDKLRKVESVKVLTDQYTSPTYAMNLAKMLNEIIDKRVCGVIHTCGATRISRYEQALEIAKLFGLDRRLILKIGLDEMSWKARRPKDSSLNVDRATRVLGNKPELFDRALKQFAQEIPSLYQSDNHGNF